MEDQESGQNSAMVFLIRLVHLLPITVSLCLLNPTGTFGLWLTEARAIFERGDKRLNHFGGAKVAIERIEFVKPKLEA